jgi:hypothetical protein
MQVVAAVCTGSLACMLMLLLCVGLNMQVVAAVCTGSFAYM